MKTDFHEKKKKSVDNYTKMCIFTPTFSTIPYTSPALNFVESLCHSFVFNLCCFFFFMFCYSHHMALLKPHIIYFIFGRTYRISLSWIYHFYFQEAPVRLFTRPMYQQSCLVNVVDTDISARAHFARKTHIIYIYP